MNKFDSSSSAARRLSCTSSVPAAVQLSGPQLSGFCCSSSAALWRPDTEAFMTDEDFLTASVWRQWTGSS